MAFHITDNRQVPVNGLQPGNYNISKIPVGTFFLGHSPVANRENPPLLFCRHKGGIVCLSSGDFWVYDGKVILDVIFELVEEIDIEIIINRK